MWWAFRVAGPSRGPLRRRPLGGGDVAALRNSLRPSGFRVTRNYASSVVPSQTVGQRLRLVHAQAIKSDLTPLQSTIKLFVWAGLNWNLWLKKNWRVESCNGNVLGATCHPWKGRTFYAVQCFRLSYSDWLFTIRKFMSIHKCFGRRNMSPSTDREFDST